MSGDGPTTVVLGFDALSPDYLDAFDLPAFEALAERGVSATLDSTFPPWTGSAWPSMYTGVDPSHHGVYSFFDFDGGPPAEADLVTRDDVDAPAIWNYLDAEGVRSAVLNVPVTHPAESFDGVLVPGYLAPERCSSHPEGVRAELSDAIGEEYRIYADEETGEASDAMLESYVDLVDLRRRAAVAMLESHDPQVAFFQVQKTDTVFHQFDDEAAFRRVYEAADRFVETVLDAVGEEANVVVCSDHGIGPTRGYNVYVNEVLRGAGLVEVTREGETPTLHESKESLAGAGANGDGGDGGNDGATVGTRAVSGLARALSGVGIEPGDVYAAASRVGADAALRRLLPDAAGSVAKHVDWKASKAYCRSGPELGVRINLEGRDAGGVVAPEDYEDVREAVVETLSAVRTPDGGPAFDWVRRREAVYEGPHAESACDVLFRPAGMDHLVATSILGKRFVSIDKYNHKTEGVFIGAGPAFDAGASVRRLSLTDVVPVTMALAGCPVPERMTGSVPEGLLVEQPTTRRYDGVTFGSDEAGASGSTDEADDGEVEARLEDLGYL